MANTLKAGSTNWVHLDDIRRLNNSAVPSSYDTMECRVLLASDDSEVVAAITMTVISGTNDYECYIPSTASLTSGTDYKIEITAIVDTDKKRLLFETITASNS